jgi:hypothetical protein
MLARQAQVKRSHHLCLREGAGFAWDSAKESERPSIPDGWLRLPTVSRSDSSEQTPVGRETCGAGSLRPVAASIGRERRQVSRYGARAGHPLPQGRQPCASPGSG